MQSWNSSDCLNDAGGGLSVVKILVADDNSNIQRMVGLALKDQGIEVVAVGNGEAAVRKIADIHPDLVLADVFMPVRNGYEVCEFVKKDARFSHIPVILLVGAFDPLDEHEAQRVGADGVLKKPFVPPDPLISMVKANLARVGAEIQPPAPASTVPAEAAYSSGSSAPAIPPPPAPDFPVEQPAAISEPHEPIHFASAEPPAEEMPARSAPVSIDAAHQPLAFGSLLKSPPMRTAEADDDNDQSFMPASHPDLVDQRTWDTPGAKEEQEEEETKESFSWRREVPDEIFEVASTEEPAEEESPTVAEVAPVPEETPIAEPAPAAQPQEATAASADEPPVWLEEETAVAPPPDSFSPDNFPGLFVEERPVLVSEATEPTEEPLIEPGLLPTPAVAGVWEDEVRKAAQLANVWEMESAAKRLEPAAAEFPSPRVNAEIPVHQPEPFESAPEVPAAAAVSAHLPSAFPKAAGAPSPAEAEHSMAWTSAWPTRYTGEAITPAPQPAPPEPASSSTSPQDMDAIVAKVLAKMSPDVLQQVTREILKPVVEALLRDELSKKS